MDPLAFFTMLFILAIVVVSNAVVQVTQGTAVNIERFGRYIQTYDAGIYLIIPFVDRVGSRINLMERVFSIPSQEVITKDNAMVRVDGVCFFKVIEASYAAYRVLDLEGAIANLSTTNIRTVLGSLDLDQMLFQRDEINNRLLKVMDDATEDWGVKITRIEIKDICPPHDLVDAMASQMKAERERRARILEAEGFKQAEILKAEGIRQATILQAEAQRGVAFLESEGRERRAQAEAVATERLSQAMEHQAASKALNYYIAQEYIKSLSTLSTGAGSKVVFLPFEASSLLSSLGGIKDILQTVSSDKIR